MLSLVFVLVACGSDDADATTNGVAPSTIGESSTEAAGYDLQGHRGARGLRPENTLPAFELALDLMVDTLELDMHLAADDVVVVWHDPIVDSAKCDVTAPVAVRSLTAAELRTIRCDRNPDPDRFPDQAAEPGAIAADDYGIVSLEEVFAFVAGYADSATKTEEQRANAAEVRFNIETKRQPDDPSAIGDDFDGTDAGVFEIAVLAAATNAGVTERVTVQSFDHRSLWSTAAENPDVSLAALTRRSDIPDFARLAAQGASIWSPDHRSVSDDTLRDAHTAGLLVIPWTVNDAEDMERLLELGVDGIITDRPDLAPAHP